MRYGSSQAVRGRVRVLTVNPQDKIVSDTGWVNNLVLNQGMNGVATRYWADSFTHAVLGDGTTATSVSGGVTTASQSNVTVTLVGGSFVFTNTATDAGRILKFSGGQRCTIVTVNSPTSAIVNVSQNVAATSFTYYFTTQTGLVNELRRSNTYHTQGGGCTTIASAPSSMTMRRSYNFPVETPVAVIYNEVGFSHTGTVANNLFSRIKLPSPVEVKPGLRARVIYEFTITMSPNTPTAKSAIITGWPIVPAVNTDTFESLEDWGLAVVTSSGATAPYRTESGVPIVANEPSATCEVLIGDSTAALSAPGDPIQNRWTAGAYVETMLNDGYTAGTYTRFRTAVSTYADVVSTSIRVFCYGHTITPGSNFLPVYTMRFEQNQTKSGSMLIGVRFSMTWLRVLA